MAGLFTKNLNLGPFGAIMRYANMGAAMSWLGQLPNAVKELEKMGVELGGFGQVAKQAGDAVDWLKNPFERLMRGLKEAQTDEAAAAEALQKFNERLEENQKIYKDASYQVGLRRQGYELDSQGLDELQGSRSNIKMAIEGLTALRDALQEKLAGGYMQDAKKAAEQIEEYNRAISDQESLLSKATGRIDELNQKQKERLETERQFNDIMTDLADAKFLEDNEALRKQFKTFDQPALEAHRNINVERLVDYGRQLQDVEASMDVQRRLFAAAGTDAEKNSVIEELRRLWTDRQSIVSDIQLAQGNIDAIDGILEQRNKKKKNAFEWEWVYQAPQALTKLAAMGGSMGESYRAPYEEDLDVIKQVLQKIAGNTENGQTALFN